MFEVTIDLLFYVTISTVWRLLSDGNLDFSVGLYQLKNEISSSEVNIARTTYFKENPKIMTIFLCLDNGKIGRFCPTLLKELL